MIKERYKLGDAFSMDFDYEGMLLYAMNTTLDTSVNDLEKLLDSFEDVNYHREAAPLYDMIEMVKFQNEYGKSEHTIDCTKKALLAFRKEVQDTMKQFEKENTIENNAPNLLDDYNEMIESFNKEQEENEKLTINDIKELVKSIPNDAKLGEYIRERI
tara:strand:+ start:19 stop:492 length:474 start_codon:yes stop_codon:yes gene_type:complete